MTCLMQLAASAHARLVAFRKMDCTKSGVDRGKLTLNNPKLRQNNHSAVIMKLYMMGFSRCFDTHRFPFIWCHVKCVQWLPPPPTWM